MVVDLPAPLAPMKPRMLPSGQFKADVVEREVRVVLAHALELNGEIAHRGSFAGIWGDERSVVDFVEGFAQAGDDFAVAYAEVVPSALPAPDGCDFLFVKPRAQARIGGDKRTFAVLGHDDASRSSSR